MQGADNSIPIYMKPVLPDHELLLWEKWIQIRTEDTSNLGKKLDKTPADLTMNLLGQVRQDKERKVALEHAQIEKKTGVRGSLWERPPRLKQHCYCEPAYEVRRTLAERGRPRVIEHIGVPNSIQEKEMGMAGSHLRKPHLLLDNEYKQYRDQREDKLYEEIKKIDPFRPSIRNLMIIGKKPPVPPPIMEMELPEITLDNPVDFCEDTLSGVYAMKINDTIFIKEIPGQNLVNLRTIQNEGSYDSCTTWSYYFNVSMKRASRCKLFIQNLGTVTLKYCWRKIKQIIPFIPEEIFEEVFFFNKNEDVISPGQSKEIFFTFISDNPDIYSESWELSMCNISFFDTIKEKFAIRLYGDSTEDIDKIKRKIEILKTRIHRKAVNLLASEFLEEIFDKVFEVVPQIYPYEKLFLESEIFILRNPVCFYHQTEVAKMKELYTEMDSKQNWDLSISTWRQTMMAKEYDDRMKYYDLLQNSHKELLKPWYEGDGLLKDKYRAVKCLLIQWVDKFDGEYARITYSFMPKPAEVLVVDPLIEQMIRNILFMRIYEHLETTIEFCAGILSSLDLNRWIDFDFCQH